MKKSIEDVLTDPKVEVGDITRVSAFGLRMLQVGGIVYAESGTYTMDVYDTVHMDAFYIIWKAARSVKPFTLKFWRRKIITAAVFYRPESKPVTHCLDGKDQLCFDLQKTPFLRGEMQQFMRMIKKDQLTWTELVAMKDRLVSRVQHYRREYDGPDLHTSDSLVVGKAFAMHLVEPGFKEAQTKTRLM